MSGLLKSVLGLLGISDDFKRLNVRQVSFPFLKYIYSAISISESVIKLGIIHI